MSSSVSSFDVLLFLEYLSFSSLVKFIPGYPIIFYDILNGIFFFFFFAFSFCILVLVDKKKIDLCVLIMYPAALVNSFTSSNRFFGEDFRVLSLSPCVCVCVCVCVYQLYHVLCK